MSAFEQFPYTNYHDLNLDWVLQVVKEAKDILNNLHDVVTGIVDTRVSEFTKEIDKIQNYVDNEVNRINNELSQAVTEVTHQLSIALNDVDMKNVETLKEVNKELLTLRKEINTMYATFNNSVLSLKTYIDSADKQQQKYTDEQIKKVQQEIIDIQIDQTVLLDPVDNIYKKSQATIDSMFYNLKSWALRALDYDALGLTAQDYDSVKLGAWQYDYLALWFLKEYRRVVNYFTFKTGLHKRLENIEEMLYNVSGKVFMYSPFSGLIEPVKNVVASLFDMVRKYTLTAVEYDALNMPAESYDNLNLTAYTYDWYGLNSLTMQSITASKYDNLSITCALYDALNLSAYTYDNYGLLYLSNV